jgi:hypothetical protein
MPEKSRLYLVTLLLALVLAAALAGSAYAAMPGGMNGPGQMPMDPGSMPMDPGQMPMDPGQMPMDPGSMPMDPGQMPMDPGSMPMDPGQMPMDPGSMPMDPGQMPMDPGSMPMDPGQMPMDPGQMPGRGHMFPDTAGSWYADYATHMAQNGFMMGFADGTFGGHRPLTRGQFAGIMARMMGVEPAKGAAFSDTSGFWGEGLVAAMAQRGVIMGRQDGTFGPYDPVTRAQMAAMLDRAWTSMHESGTSVPGFTERMRQMREAMLDVNGHWAEPHIGRMYGMGVLQGDGRGSFRPEEGASRAHASAMMWRWYELHLSLPQA